MLFGSDGTSSWRLGRRAAPNRQLHLEGQWRKKPGKQQLWLAVSCLLGVIVGQRITNGLEGTEFEAQASGPRTRKV
jgi:hypothetical protein